MNDHLSLADALQMKLLADKAKEDSSQAEKEKMRFLHKRFITTAWNSKRKSCLRQRLVAFQGQSSSMFFNLKYQAEALESAKTAKLKCIKGHIGLFSN